MPLLPNAAQRLQIDAILLQEVWHPPDGFLKLRQLNNPITKLRNAREGVAIITHKDAKTVHMKQYELDGLEAVWAVVMCGSVRTITGSVYIPPGDFKARNCLILSLVTLFLLTVTLLLAWMLMLAVYYGMINVLEFHNIVLVLKWAPHWKTLLTNTTSMF